MLRDFSDTTIPKLQSTAKGSVASMIAWSVFIALQTISMAGCGNASTNVGTLTAEDLNEDTTLGSGDVFDVRVYGEEDLSAQYRVAQDGSIDFPLIGRVAVAGLEPTAVADRIQLSLQERNMLVSPHVSVVVREYNSKRITVLGAVRTPGSFPMRAGLRVVEAISLAGGFSSLASRDSTLVTRRNGTEIRRFRVPVDRITSGQDVDVPLRAGDIVHVPERAFSSNATN